MKLVSPTIFWFVVSGIAILAVLIIAYSRTITLSPTYTSLVQTQPTTSPAPTTLPAPTTSTAPALTSILQLTEPADGLITNKKTIALSGASKPNAVLAVVSANTSQLLTASSDGKFKLSLSLVEGINTISVTAFDEQGQETIVDRTIFYTQEPLE